MPRGHDHDVAIIGGGPAGACAAALLAQAGHDVVVFEASAFPRFHIGESLVPAVNTTLARIGLLDGMADRGYVQKNGVQFFSRKGQPTRPFYFSEASNDELHHTWQVLRSDFDAMLLDTAARAGAKVSIPARVVDVVEEDGAVQGVRIRRSSNGEEGNGEEEVRARVVLDASGYTSALARGRGKRRTVEGLENASVFAHYENERRDSGVDAGSTLIFRLGDGAWLWFIPLVDVVSIGLVAPATP